MHATLHLLGTAESSTMHPIRCATTEKSRKWATYDFKRRRWTESTKLVRTCQLLPGQHATAQQAVNDIQAEICSISQLRHPRHSVRGGAMTIVAAPRRVVMRINLRRAGMTTHNAPQRRSECVLPRSRAACSLSCVCIFLSNKICTMLHS